MQENDNEFSFRGNSEEEQTDEEAQDVEHSTLPMQSLGKFLKHLFCFLS
jgi:hypothetical protein